MYATNFLQDRLVLEATVLVYRAEYLIERNFGRPKGNIFSENPLYLQDHQRAIELMRLLSIALRALSLTAHLACKKVLQTREKLTGLSASIPKRVTKRSTTETLLRAFKGIYLSFVLVNRRSYRYFTSLSERQRKILSLLDIPASLFSSLKVDSVNSQQLILWTNQEYQV